MNPLFLIAAGTAVIASMAALTRRNVLHAILCLIVSFGAIGLVFFMLGAPFIAALEIITYAGAIMVLFLFAVMLLSLGGGAVAQERRWQPTRSWTGPALVGGLLLAELLYILMQSPPGGAPGIPISPTEVGKRLLLRYPLGVELVAMLLLAALIGAGRLGRPERTGDIAKGEAHDGHSG